MRKITLGLLGLLLGVFLFASPVLALTYQYQIPVNITENGTTSYPNGIALSFSINNTNLQTLMYINSSANNTDFTTSRHLPVSDRVTFFLPSLTQSSTNIYQYYLGADTQLSTFPIITGYGGNVSVADAPELELGNNFAFNISGGLDPTQINGKWWNKPGALTTNTTASGTVNITANSTLIQSTNTTSSNMSWGFSSSVIPPNGAGNYTAIETLVGAATHWQAVLTNDGDTSYISTSNNTTTKDVYTIGTVSIPSTSTNISVKVYILIASSSGTGTVYGQPLVWLGGVETAGAEVSTADAAYTEFSETLARPGGGNWSVSDLSSLQIGVGLRRVTVGHDPRCTQVFAVISYSDNMRAGEQLNVAQNSTITNVDFSLKRTGSPTGTANITIRNDATDALIGTIGTLNISTLTTSFAWYSFNTTSVAVGVSGIKILIEIPSFAGNATYVEFGYINSNNISGNLTTYSGASYTNNSSTDAAIRLTYTSSLLASGLTSENQSISLTLASENLSVLRNGVLLNSIVLLGSIVNNANDYQFCTTNAIPYATNITLSVNGTLQLYYAPTSIITNSNLPNRASSSNNGTINWGTNPGNINVSLSSMQLLTASSASSKPTGSSHILPTFNPTPGQSAETSTGSNVAGWYELVSFLNTTTSIDIVVLWYILGFALAILSGLALIVIVGIVAGPFLPIQFIFGAGLMVIDIVLSVFAYSYGVMDKLVPLIGGVVSFGLFLAFQQLTTGGRSTYQ